MNDLFKFSYTVNIPIIEKLSITPLIGGVSDQPLIIMAIQDGEFKFDFGSRISYRVGNIFKLNTRVTRMGMAIGFGLCF